MPVLVKKLLVAALAVIPSLGVVLLLVGAALEPAEFRKHCESLLSNADQASKAPISDR